MLLRDLHPVERPGRRLALSGPQALSDAELLAVVCGLRTLPKSEKALTRTQRLKLAAALELARRRSPENNPRPSLDSPLRVLEQVPRAVREARKEHLLAFYVDARSRLLHLETVSIGTLSASLVHPREVFAPAISQGAAAVIVCHNHPSGDCSPSPEDKDATRRLQRAGELLGIPLLDHLIVSERGFCSFKEHGLLS